ncbi:MAG: GNAT family N-acetyltransferase [Candidatus Nanopelagicales bacterium]
MSNHARARIRLASPDDVTTIQAIEVAAGARFASIGMPEIAADPPPDGRLLRRLMKLNQAWVAEADQRLVGYAIGIQADESAHLDQVSVEPQFSRRGIGTALVNACSDWAGEIGAIQLSLFTFADVPWNAPAYRSMGFSEVLPADFGPELKLLWQRELETDLHSWHRVAMSRPVSPRDY